MQTKNIYSGIKLLISRILKEDFENDLYQKVQVSELDNNKLLYELVTINYRKDNYKKYLKELLKNKVPEKKYYSITLKEECLLILESTDKNTILNSVNRLSSLSISKL